MSIERSKTNLDLDPVYVCDKRDMPSLNGQY